MPNTRSKLARDANLVAAYIDGGSTASFAAVGRRYGVSGERARQLVVEYERVTGRKVPRASERRVPPARPPRPSLAQRLLQHASHNAASGCWQWIGSVGGAGHPLFSGGGENYAHRLSYKLWREAIPVRFRVVPSCGLRTCINPFHLLALPPAEALRFTARWDESQGAFRPRMRKPQTHCRRGHELTPANTEWNHSTKRGKDGTEVPVRTRLCRICAQARRRRYRQSRANRIANTPRVLRRVTLS